MEGKEQIMPSGIYSIDDLKEYGKDRNWCPYFLARFTVSTLRNKYYILKQYKVLIISYDFRFYMLKL